MQLKQAKISIIMPSYNRADIIDQSIESCLNQKYSNFELIIVDDCSSDNSIEVINKYLAQDDRIKLIVNNTNLKLPMTLNRGFKEATGDYFTWISDDNVFHQDSLVRMAEVLDKHKDYGLVYTDYFTINDKGEQISRIYQEPPEYLPIRCCVGPSFLYRAEVAKKVGEYNSKLFLVEDYEYWLRIGLIAKLYHIPEPLYYYRVHNRSLTAKRKDDIRIAKNVLKNQFRGKYQIPKHLKPINDLYNQFISKKGFSVLIKIIIIILLNPITTLKYIIKNIRRL